MAAHKGHATKYCILKLLNTRRQYLELGKHTFRTGRAVSVGPSAEAGVDLRNPGLVGTADLRVSSLSGRNPRELTEVQEKLDHLLIKEEHTLLSVIEDI
jgi:hypothetical protein